MIIVRLTRINSQKLRKTPSALLNKADQGLITSLTDGFSSAYLKEAYFSALLIRARRTATESGGVGENDGSGALFKLLQDQIETLKSEMSARS
jgi:hypothetical protein